MYGEWMKKISLDVNDEDLEEVKLSLRDRFTIWLLNLRKE